MKAYICLPADKYYACANQFDHIANVFCVELKRYYGATGRNYRSSGK